MKFYDTCCLLTLQEQAFQEPFIISPITLKELENIKTSAQKDADIKMQARHLAKTLIANQDTFIVSSYLPTEQELIKYPILENNNDSKIVLSAFKETSNFSIIDFYTQDLCCYFLAKEMETEHFKVHFYHINTSDDYCGFRVLNLNEQDTASFYEHFQNWDNDVYQTNINEYLVLPQEGKNFAYKCLNDKIVEVPFRTFNSQMFGAIKPKDIYQQLAMDSFASNQITMIRGAAGTGKTFLSFAYLFELLEKHKIDKIIVFCNTVATAGSAKLGFYPGTRDEKLLDSQIGNLLASKMGDKMIVEKMIDDGQLILLPMSDIRGYDTSGMRAGIYISEAQNMDIELMRLALQRIGDDSICILDGDSNAQVDLNIYSGDNNGMRRVSEIFKNHDFYGEVTLQNIYRSKIAALAQEL